MKKALSFILVFSMLFCVCCMSASADGLYFYGDVNFDSDVNVSDVSEIQRHIAKHMDFSKLQAELADVDIDGGITIIDATTIQLKMASESCPKSRVEDVFYTILYINNLATNYDDGVIETGVPVTFRVHDYNYEGAYESYDKVSPLRYEFYVNGEIVSDTIAPYYSNSFTHTFEEAGSYKVEAVVYNIYDEYDSFEWRYNVVENDGDDSLKVSGVSKNNHHFDKYSNIEIYAHASGGTAPYEYRFFSEGLGIEQDFSESNSLNLGRLALGEYEMEIFIKDADGNIVSDTYSFEVELPLNG